MIANLIAMILIILIHYSAKSAVDISLGYKVNYLVQEALSNGFARSAVPIFALLSGYFLIAKYISSGYSSLIINKFHTLIIPYILASFILILPFIINTIIFKSSSLQDFPFYSYIYQITLHPVSGQYWFLRDLIILVLMSPLLFYINKTISTIILFTLFIMWLVNFQPFPIVAGWYLVNIETLFFFVLGAIIQKSSINLEYFIFCKNRYKIIVFILWTILILFRIYLDPTIDTWYTDKYSIESLLLYKTAIILGIISIFQIASLLKDNKLFIYLSGLTFFVFLFHYSPLYRIVKQTENIIPLEYSFYFYFPFVVIFMFTLAYIMSKKLTFLYNILTGNRNPNKSIERLNKEN